MAKGPSDEKKRSSDSKSMLSELLWEYIWRENCQNITETNFTPCKHDNCAAPIETAAKPVWLKDMKTN